MQWRGFKINGIWKDLAHLNPFSIVEELDGVPTTLLVTFGHHCFTDKKGKGPLLYAKEQRYWCEDRYRLSFDLPKLISEGFVHKYAIAFLDRNNAEQYHYTEIYDYVIFFDINKAQNIEDTLKIKIVSAYEIASWGRETLPKGKAKRIRWILSRRRQGMQTL